MHAHTYLFCPPGPRRVLHEDNQAEKHVVGVQHSRHDPEGKAVQVLAQEAEEGHGRHAHPELRLLLVAPDL